MRAAVVWVDVLLGRWGRWAIRRESGALGYASSCFLGDVAGGGDGYDSAEPRGVADGDMEAVNAAVMRLPVVQVGCLVVVYQLGAGRSDRENAERAGVMVRTLTRYIHDAQQKIALDISLREHQNPRQSVNGGNTPERNQPVTAQA